MTKATCQGRVFCGFSSKGLETIVEGTTQQEAANVSAGTRSLTADDLLLKLQEEAQRKL